MKLKVHISEETFSCKGRVKALGKKAKPPFCYRAKSTGKGSDKTTVTEIHSRVTGKRIGWLGPRSQRFVTSIDKAQTFNYLNGFQVDSNFMWFLRDSQQHLTTDWNKGAKDGLKAILKEAKKA